MDFDNEINDPCFGDLDLCTDGLTMTLYLKVEDLTSDSSHHYLSSGGHTSTSYGISVWSDNGIVKVAARTTTLSWGPVELSTSVFDGKYVTGDIDEAYLKHIESLRNDSSRASDDSDNEVIEIHNNA